MVSPEQGPPGRIDAPIWAIPDVLKPKQLRQNSTFAASEGDTSGIRQREVVAVGHPTSGFDRT